ncbi:ribonuclease BN-like family protein [Actinomyces graevenitzii F0530]|uniref:Ribonuclease BN-like family protein n=1 Tax=Actinomyces graevenitzii F0530 TaxID=1321817 RepID=U1RQP1_9ACTO|nr:YhjD/YihY/BrkB family envelope integrity protein [Actinomyces graevenitzii]ERH20757.1 ribonuclease BN-like family protein [Actinomyces graevenitzii F0530]
MLTIRKIVVACKAVYARWQATTFGRAYARFKAERGAILAAGIAYTGLVSLFAALTLVVSSLLQLSDMFPAWRAAMVKTLSQALPGVISDGSSSGLVRLDQLELNQGIGIAAFIGTVTLVATALEIPAVLRGGVRAMFSAPVLRANFVALRLRDAAMVLVVVIGVSVSSAALALAVALHAQLDSYLHIPGSTSLLQLFAYGLGFIVDGGVLTAIVILAKVEVHRRVLLIGSFAGASAMTMLRLVGSQGLASGTVNPLLGSFSTVVVLLIWMHAAAMVLLYASAWMAIATKEKSTAETVAGGAALTGS